MDEQAAPPLRLMRPPQVADALGTTVGHLAKLRLTGRGPAFVRLGRSIAYDERELRRWIDARTFKSTAEASVAEKEAT
jgi:predicted DNA-binding transcriptional regulator AlpA